MKVRRIAFGMGYRYRLNVRDLPGSPDLVFKGRRKVVFVHGCFWHGHHCKLGDRLPKTRPEFWKAKIARNVQRDGEVLARLAVQGWSSLLIWECELTSRHDVGSRLAEFLGPAKARPMDVTRAMGSTVTSIRGQGS